MQDTGGSSIFHRKYQPFKTLTRKEKFDEFVNFSIPIIGIIFFLVIYLLSLPVKNFQYFYNPLILTTNIFWLTALSTGAWYLWPMKYTKIDIDSKCIRFTDERNINLFNRVSVYYFSKRFIVELSKTGKTLIFEDPGYDKSELNLIGLDDKDINILLEILRNQKNIKFSLMTR